MPIDLEEYTALKEASERLRRKADKAKGALDVEKKRLKDEFDCDSIEQAEEMMADLEKKLEAANESYDESLGEFKEKWGDILEGVS